jgi:hypothetical protein
MAALFDRVIAMLRYGAADGAVSDRAPSRKHKQPEMPLDRAREQHRILRRQAESCGEPQLSSRLNRMGMMADAIIRETSHKSGLLPVVRRFYSFDLPLTVELLERYEKLMRSEYYDKEMEYRAKRIEQLLATLARRYVRYLNRLIQADMTQMDMELAAYERMLKQSDIPAR